MSTRHVPVPPQIPGFSYVSGLGSGGFADVFLYNQQRPARQVAIKVLHDASLDSGARERFDAEADLMALLSNHQHIVTIYQADLAADGRPFLVMEYCPKPNLGLRYKREPFGLAEALRTMVQITGAVESLHRAGVLHRDIKPANILVTEYNRPVLTDFGISVVSGEASQVQGLSVPWSPPESLADSMTAGVPADVYALGATLYSLLAGRSPFEVPGGDNTALAMVDRIERQPLTPLNRSDVPTSLERVLATSMAKQPGARYPSALAFARALQQVQTELRMSVTQVEIRDDGPGEGPIADDEDDPGTRVRSIVSIDPTPATVTAAVRAQAAGSAAITPVGAVPRVSPGPVGQPGQPGQAFATPTHAAGGVGYGSLADAATVGPGARDWGSGRGIGMEADPATIARVSVPAPASEAVAAPASRSRGKIVAAVVGAVVLVGAGIGLVSLLGKDSAQSPEASPSASVKPMDPIGSTTPVVTDLSGAITDSEITFTWTNPQLQDGDTYLWRVPSLTGDVPFENTPKAEVTLPYPGGEVCLEVVLRRSNGRGSEPATACAGA